MHSRQEFLEVTGASRRYCTHNISIQAASPKINRNFKRGAKSEEKKKAELKPMSMEEIQAEEVEWLLYPLR